MADNKVYESLKSKIQEIHDAEKEGSVTNVMVANLFKELALRIGGGGSIELDQNVSESGDKAPSSAAVRKYINSLKNAVNGLAGLDENSRLDSGLLPEWVNNYQEFGGFADVRADGVNQMGSSSTFGVVVFSRPIGKFVYKVGSTYYASWPTCADYGTISNLGVSPALKRLYGDVSSNTIYRGATGDLIALGNGGAGSGSSVTNYTLRINDGALINEPSQVLTENTLQLYSVLSDVNKRSQANVFLEIVGSTGIINRIPAIVCEGGLGGKLIMIIGQQGNTLFSVDLQPTPEDCTVFVSDILEDFTKPDTTLWVVVDKLPERPAEGNEGKVHVVPLASVMMDEDTLDATQLSSAINDRNSFVEFIWVQRESASAWEKLGEFKAEVDLSGYIKGIRTYNGFNISPNKAGYINTTYGDIYVDSVEDSEGNAIELKVNPNGSIEQKTAIVTPDTENLQAEAGKLYRFDKEVNTLAVSLPDMDGYEYATDIMFHFTTGSAPQLTIDTKGAEIMYSRDFKIEAESTYEMSLLWDGTAWWAALAKNTKEQQS